MHRAWSFLRLTFLVVCTCVLAHASAGAAIMPDVAAKLDPRLITAAASGLPDALPVWIEFADKGDLAPSELAMALARARDALTPRNRARRERLGITPLVDERDLPLYAPYVEELQSRGLAPFATSRWFNRVAVRVPTTRLTEAAALGFVRAMRPVEVARRIQMEPEPAGQRLEGRVSPACATCATATHVFNYGLNASAVQQIGVPAVHDSGFIGTGVLIAILDDGFNFHNKHEALAGANVPAGFERDFVDGDYFAQDTLTHLCCDHGTWVMGCMAGNKPGQYVGTAPGAQYALARTEVDASESTIEMVYWGMAAEWADSLGADIITTSLGYSTFDGGIGNYTFAQMDGRTTTISQAAEMAASKGILVLAAAGNEGGTPWSKITAPADVNGDSLIAVGAVTLSGARTGFSSLGPSADGRIKPDLMALGSANWLTDVSGNPQAYAQHSGTSFATPLMAGLAACMIQARPGFSPQGIIRALRETASRAGAPDTLMGYGIPNGLEALRWAGGGLSVSGPPVIPLDLVLVGPNPRQACDDPSVVRFALGSGAPASARGHLRVLDAQGRHVRDLFDGVLTRGEWLQAGWNGSDDHGRAAPTGLYFIAFDAAGRRSAVRVVNLR
jgi:serine protease AprX